MKRRQLLKLYDMLLNFLQHIITGFTYYMYLHAYITPAIGF